MQFSLRTLLLAMVIIAVFTAIATWNPVFGVLGFMLGAMTFSLFWSTWNNGAALVACGLGVAILLLDFAALSYTRMSCFEFGPRETCYAVEISRGRVLVFRLEKWPFRVPPRTYVLADGAGNWNERMMFSSPTLDLELAGCEYSVGENSIFDVRTSRHRSCPYSMIGIPIWLIACLPVVVAVVRAAMLLRWSRTTRLNTQEPQAAKESGDWPSILVRFSKRWVLISVCISGALFYAILIIDWAVPVSANQPSYPPTLITITFLLVLIQAIGCLFVEIELPKSIKGFLSVLFYVFVGGVALFGAVAFAVAYGSLASLFSDSLSGDFQAVRFGCLFAILVLTALAAKGRKSIGLATQMRIALASTALSLLIVAMTFVVNFQTIGRSTLEPLHLALMMFGFLTGLLNIVMLGGAFARSEVKSFWLGFGLAMLLVFVGCLFALEPDFERAPLSDAISKANWQFRLHGLLAAVGVAAYFYLRQTVACESQRKRDSISQG